MASKGKIDEIIDEGAIKGQITFLKSYLDSIIDQFGELAVAIDNVNGKLKGAKGFNDTNDAIKKNGENLEKATRLTREFESVNKKLTESLETQTALQNGLGTLIKEKAKADQRIIETKKQIIKEGKEEVKVEQQKVINLDELIKASKRQVDSIKAIVEENKKLKAIRDSLDTNTQVAEINSLNQQIDKNTNVIKANTDAASQQKMNIGNYKSAVEGLQLTLTVITAQMSKMASEGNDNSAEFNELKNQAAQTEKQISDFVQTISELDKKGGTLKSQLKGMKEELAQMALRGEENTEAFNHLVAKAGELEDTIGDVDQAVKNMASDTQIFEGVTSALTGIAGGFEAIVGVTEMATGSNEELQAAMLNIQKAIAITNGLQAVSAMLANESAAKTLAAKTAEWIGYNKVIASQSLSVALTNAEVAAGNKLSIGKKILIALQWAYNKALYSNPLIAFIVALAAAGAGVYYLGKALGWWGNSNKEAKESLKALNNEFAKTKKQNEEFIAVLKARKTSQEEVINQVIDLRKNEYAKTEEILTKTGALYKADSDEYKAALEQKQKASDDFMKSQMDAILLLESIMSEVNNNERKKILGDEAFAIEQVQKRYQSLFNIIEKLDIDPFKKAEYANAVMKKAEQEGADIKESFRADDIKKAEEEAKKQREIAEKKYADILDEERKFVDDSLDYLNKYADAYKKIEEKKEGNADPFMAQVDAQIEAMEFLMAKKEWQANKDKKQTEDEIALAETKRDMLIELGQQTFDSLQSIANSGFEKKLMEIDAQAQADEEAKQKELDRAGNNAAAKDRIEAKYAEKEKQREAEKRKIQLQQAKFNKMAAMFQIGIDTAVAIMKAMAEQMYWMIPIISAMGALQLATVAAQPLPKYFKGRDGGPAEFAWVGERGTEAIELPGGKTFLTPDRPTLTFLPEHASVIPHEELLRTAGAMSMQNLQFTDRSDREFAELKAEIAGLNKGFDKVAKVIIDKKEIHLSISESGIQASSSRGASRTKYLNQNVRL